MKLLDRLTRADLIDILAACTNSDNPEIGRCMRALDRAGKYSAATDDEIERVDWLLDRYDNALA